MNGIISLDEMDEANETMLEILRNTFDSVTKFNPNHDELGRFTSGGVSSAVADSIIARVKANGGLSVKILTGEEPTDGFMVAQQGHNLEIKEEDFFDAKKGRAALSAYLKAKKLVFGKDQYLGLWWNKDEKEISLDVVDKIKTRSEATNAGRERNQQAIWDVKNQEEINTGGTGDRTTEPTLVSSETSKAFGGDDGSGDRGVRVPSLGKVRSGEQRVVQQTIRAKVFKVSFGGDRSEAGRYAANQRWQGHTQAVKPRPVIGFIGKRTHEITADGAIHPKSLTDEIEKEIIDLPRKKLTHSESQGGLQSHEGAAKSMVCANISNQMAVAMVSTQQIKEAYAEIVVGSVSAVDSLNAAYGREDWISQFVGTWATTSNDGDDLSLALQDSAAELFGLKNAVSWSRNEADGGSASEAVDYQPTEKYSTATNRVLTAFLQAQYDATQQYLADKGIKSVTVFRGMRFDSKSELEKAGFDHYTQDDYSNHPDDEKVAQGSAIVRQRPLSSWSVSRKIAVDFAGEEGLGVVMKTRVPSSHIVSTPLTGFGCAQESEVVVMDDPKSLYHRVGGGREVDYIQGPTRRNYEIFGRDLGAWERKDEPAEFVAL